LRESSKDSYVALSRAANSDLQGGATANYSLPSDEGDSEAGITATQVLLIVRAYWKIAAIIAVSIIVVGAVAIKLMPKVYAATATLKVDSDVSDPLAGQVNQLNQTSGYIPTEIQLMESNQVLLPVVDRLQLVKNKTYIAGFRGDPTPENQREWVKLRLIKDLDIQQGPMGSLLINVTAMARTPQLAADIANAIVDVYLKQERERIDRPAIERVKRYTEQLAELKAKVTLASDAVAEYRQRTGITDASGAKNADVEMLSAMQARLEEARNARRVAEVRATERNTGGAPGADSRARLENLRGMLGQQEAQRAQLLTTLGENHPKVKELDNTMAVTRQAIANEAQTNSMSADAELLSARHLERKMQDAVDQQRAKVLQEGSVQDEGNKFMLELESAQSVYKRALDGYDQIMFASAGHYTYVDLVNHAAVPLTSTKPNKLKLFLVNIMAGLFFALAGPMCYELFFDRRVRCRDDIERGFGVPVLSELDAFDAVAVPRAA
jgi:succinoglycan biosynthesis transport protein ExoP